ncbi:MAG: hypothetical protein M3N26_00265 [Pseudomonadota bacterium]|nr:hypothetical protein [Pseudomonadota bacterium]
MSRNAYVMLDADEVSLRMPVPHGMNDWLCELHNRAQQRMTFDHSQDQSLRFGKQ